jgi:hypothetical protein
VDHQCVVLVVRCDHGVNEAVAFRDKVGQLRSEIAISVSGRYRR